MSNGDLFKFQRTFEDGRRKAPFDSSICPPLDQALDKVKGENPTATFVQVLILHPLILFVFENVVDYTIYKV